MIRKELTYMNLKAETREEVIVWLADKLLAAGMVKDTYKDAVLQREEEYPTGLPLGVCCMAMPHTFAAHVNEPAIAVARLEKPVKFVEMGTKDVELEVSLVMMMAVSNPQEQVGLLRKILKLFSDEEVIKSLMESNTTDEMYQVLRCIDEE